MKGFKKGLGMACAVACGLAAAGAAQAATVIAGPYVDLNSKPFCTVVNTRPVSVTVTIEAQDVNGADTNFTTKTLAPNEGTFLFGGPNAVLCRFTAKSKTSIAGMLVAEDTVTGFWSTAILAQ